MTDVDLIELGKMEYKQLGERMLELEEEIKVALIPADPNDDKNSR